MYKSVNSFNWFVRFKLPWLEFLFFLLPKLIGVISEGDILRALLAKKNLETFSEAIMNKTFIYLTKDNQSKAAVYFRKHLVPIIPIINKKMEIIKFLTLEKFLSK